MEAPDSDFGPRGSSSVINVGEQMLDKCLYVCSMLVYLFVFERLTYLTYQQMLL